MPEASSIGTIGSLFIELQSVDSSNNYARKQIASAKAGSLPDGAVFFAHEQTHGKGQHGRSWISNRSENIMMSIVLRPKKILPSQPFHLVSWAAVSILEFFSRYAGTDTKIKWPNDLYWKDRKAGGILIETQIASNEAGTSEWNWAVIGIGININQTEFPPSLNNPVSLRQITGKTFDPVALARELCTVLDEKYQLINHAGFASIYEGYNANLYGLNKTQRFKQDNRVFEAIVKGVSPEGKLLLEHSFGEEFGFHDLEWLERG